MALVIFIHIYILLLLGSINTSIVYNDQFEDIRLAHQACTSSQKTDGNLIQSESKNNFSIKMSTQYLIAADVHL